jgi:hypothetical protein
VNFNGKLATLQSRHGPTLTFEKMEFHVRQKQDVGFTPKNHEKRTVPGGEPGRATKAL